MSLLTAGRYISNIEMPGGKIRYVPLHPPKDGAVRTSSAAEWKIDFDELERTINSKTKMIVRCVRWHSDSSANYFLAF